MEEDKGLDEELISVFLRTARSIDAIYYRGSFVSIILYGNINYLISNHTLRRLAIKFNKLSPRAEKMENYLK